MVFKRCFCSSEASTKHRSEEQGVVIEAFLWGDGIGLSPFHPLLRASRSSFTLL